MTKKEILEIIGKFAEEVTASDISGQKKVIYIMGFLEETLPDDMKYNWQNYRKIQDFADNTFYPMADREEMFKRELDKMAERVNTGY